MSSLPSVAIVIPCRNEQKYIARCLDSIVDCDYPKHLLNVFVCDGQSDDGTVEIVKRYESQHPYIRLINNVHRTTPQALNLGLKASDADVRIILGAHADIKPDFVSKNVAALQMYPQAGCVGGIIENIYEDEISRVISCAMSSGFGVGNAHFRTGAKEGFVDTVAFGAYRKEVFDKIGWFDETLIRNQDDEFNFRVTKAGFKILLDKKIQSRYYVRASFAKLYRQYYQYGYWKVYVNRKHRTITTIRQLIPLFFVLFLLLGFMVSFLHNYLALAYVAVLLLYVLLAFFSASKFKLSFLPTLQVVYTFFILHFSYGWGYLRGMFRFLFSNVPHQSVSELTR